MSPCTEAGHSYHLACFVAAVGACLERNVYVERAGRHYPNLFVVLVGPSGGARKSTALRFGLDLVTAIDRKILVAWTIDSREGFLQDLSDRGKLHGHRRGVHAILRLDELRALIDKSRMEGLGNIVPMLTHAYDCLRLSMFARGRTPYRCHSPPSHSWRPQRGTGSRVSSRRICSVAWATARCGSPVNLATPSPIHLSVTLSGGMDWFSSCGR